jgi:hypothetical protein
MVGCLQRHRGRTAGEGLTEPARWDFFFCLLGFLLPHLLLSQASPSCGAPKSVTKGWRDMETLFGTH